MLQDWWKSSSPTAMECSEGLSYNICGSYCPPTCGDKTPDCGKLQGQRNEGCFCPQDTFLQEGKCVRAEECRCMFNGEKKEVSGHYSNYRFRHDRDLPQQKLVDRWHFQNWTLTKPSTPITSVPFYRGWSWLNEVLLVHGRFKYLNKLNLQGFLPVH